MIPDQTVQILCGVVVALLYASAVLAVGVFSLTMFVSRQARSAVCARAGWIAFLWLGFVLGQGTLGVVWLVLSLAGVLYEWLVWIVCALGWFVGYVMLYRARHQAVGLIWSRFLSLRHRHSWYFWIGASVLFICLLQGTIALLPPSVDDALQWYLTVAKVTAASNKLEFYPFIAPHSGLYPLQVEIHWAALFTISNETAVTVWDYLCALSLLCGIGCLSWSLTASRRVAVLSILMVLSSSAFHDMIGAGKTDNAGAQYGIAAFLWVVLWPDLRHRSAALAGACMGWVLAARYTNFIVLPALLVFAAVIVRRSCRILPTDVAVRQPKRLWFTDAIVGSIAAVLAGSPMLVKNWLLVGCPLAPQFGCQDTFWADMFWGRSIFWIANRQGISMVDFLSYPFVLTFAHREGMLGNISPLFIGFLPFLLAYRRSPLVRPALIAGGAGLLSVITWWLLINKLTLFARWALVAFGLFAVTLSAAVVAAEQDRHDASRITHWLIRSTIVIVLLFLLFQSRAAVYGVRYLAAVDSRAVKYEPLPYTGYDIAEWLNAHVQPGQRVALGIWGGYTYFVKPRILFDAGSTEEYEWFWKHRDRPLAPDSWSFYTQRGFTYVVVAKNSINEPISGVPDSIRLKVVFMGQKDAVLKIEESTYRAQ